MGTAPGEEPAAGMKEWGSVCCTDGWLKESLLSRGRTKGCTMRSAASGVAPSHQRSSLPYGVRAAWPRSTAEVAARESRDEVRSDVAAAPCPLGLLTVGTASCPVHVRALEQPSRWALLARGLLPTASTGCRQCDPAAVEGTRQPQSSLQMRPRTAPADISITTSREPPIQNWPVKPPQNSQRSATVRENKRLLV